ncbi:MAG TPA: hypothetical protein VN620_08635 [Candidatus Methylomirabilis sp.]|nr:hypothetical protein [Candidatus Methylomirabilis sp.]
MKHIFLLLSLATFVVALSPFTFAQGPMRAPDGNSFTRIVSIFIAPIPNAPFSANVSTQWTRQTSDGATVVVKNRRMVARDSQGHVFEERRRFVPADSNSPSLLFQTDYVDPARRTRTICFPSNQICDVYNFFTPPSEASLPVGPLPDGKRYLSRENLGADTIEGLETIGTRETISTSPGVVGNDREVVSTKEFWYSPRLGVNLVVKRFDPLQGTQVFTVSNINLSEPDARLFAVPAQFKVADQRTTETTPAK